MNATLNDITVHQKELPEEVIEKQRILAAKLPATDKVIELVGSKNLKDFFANFNIQNYSTGPEHLILRGIQKDNDYFAL